MAQDIYNHGISGGFNGWIYYNETCQFYAKNQSSIVKLVEYLSEDHDYKSAQDMVKSLVPLMRHCQRLDIPFTAIKPA